MSTTMHEAEQILKLVNGDLHQAVQIVERQLGILVLRTQVLLSLSGIVITVTGFSGQAIARVGNVARFSISAGIFLVLLAAVVAIVGVLRVRWLTQQLADDPRVCIQTGLDLRDKKTGYLQGALICFVVGFSLYCVAIAQLLLSSHSIH